MNLWQSIALISPWQIAYAVGLAALFWSRGPSPAAWVLLADFIAIIAVLGAMDMGLLDRDGATRSMLVIWCVSTAILAAQPAKILAAFGAIGVAAFIATLVFGVQIGTTSAIVNAVAFIMLVVAYGLGGDSGNRRGFLDWPLSLGVSSGNLGLAKGGVAQSAGLLSQNRRGLN